MCEGIQTSCICELFTHEKRNTLSAFPIKILLWHVKKKKKSTPGILNLKVCQTMLLMKIAVYGHILKTFQLISRGNLQTTILCPIFDSRI